MKKDFFSGVTTALITPFKKGEIDFASLKKLIHFQLDKGIKGFVVCGSTGEAATLELDEKKQLLRFVLSEVSQKVPVIVGAGTFNTAETENLVREFDKLNPDGYLIVSPYYNKPPQRGMIEHFSKIAQATTRPIIIYNVPSRTSVKIEPKTVQHLSQKVTNIVGVKEAAGDLDVIKQLKDLCDPSFMVLSGDDGTFIEAMALGAQGVISVISHVAPEWCVQAAHAGKEANRLKTMTDKAKMLKKEADELCELLFCESNPIPVKWALKEMGVIDSAELRLPLVELDEKFHQPLKKSLKKLGAL